MYSLFIASDKNRAEYIYLCDLGASLFASILGKGPDTLIFILGYKYTSKTISWKVYLGIFSFILLLTYAPFVVGLTFVPFIFAAQATDTRKYLLSACFTVYGLSAFISNLFFTSHFYQVLYRVNVLRTLKLTKQYQVFAIKCCIHFVTRYTPF